MALSLGTLSAYTKQLVEPLLTSAVIGAKTQQMIMDGGIVIPKAKSAVAIPLMDTDQKKIERDIQNLSQKENLYMESQKSIKKDLQKKQKVNMTDGSFRIAKVQELFLEQILMLTGE